VHLADRGQTNRLPVVIDSECFVAPVQGPWQNAQVLHGIDRVPHEGAIAGWAVAPAGDLTGGVNIPGRAKLAAARKITEVCDSVDRGQRYSVFQYLEVNREETKQMNRSQTVTSSQKHRDPRYPPYVFTEHGILMLSSVLRSERAIEVNIEIMRAFVRLREMLAGHKELARKLAVLEKKYDAQFRDVFEAIRQLMIPPNKKDENEWGFRLSKKTGKTKEGGG